jgi:hypothetical protein
MLVTIDSSEYSGPFMGVPKGASAAICLLAEECRYPQHIRDVPREGCQSSHEAHQ